MATTSNTTLSHIEFGISIQILENQIIFWKKQSFILPLSLLVIHYLVQLLLNRLQKIQHIFYVYTETVIVSATI